MTSDHDEHKSQQAERRAFVLEEYKSCIAGMTHHHQIYRSLEIYAFGGSVLAYGVLFGLTSNTAGHKTPLIVWWAIFVLLGIACVRCWGHYVTVGRFQEYLRKIEAYFYPDRIPVEGYERFSAEKNLNAGWLLMFNGMAWFAVLCASFSLAVYETLLPCATLLPT